MTLFAGRTISAPAYPMIPLPHETWEQAQQHGLANVVTVYEDIDIRQPRRALSAASIAASNTEALRDAYRWDCMTRGVGHGNL